MLLLFMSQQYYSLVGHFFFLGAPACDSPLEELASDYSSSLILLEVSPANYSFRMPNANQAKVLTGGGDLHEAQVDVPLSVSHSCV